MKLYLVSAGEYSDYHVMAIFSTIEKAEEFLKRYDSTLEYYESDEKTHGGMTYCQSNVGKNDCYDRMLEAGHCCELDNYDCRKPENIHMHKQWCPGHSDSNPIDELELDEGPNL